MNPVLKQKIDELCAMDEHPGWRTEHPAMQARLIAKLCNVIVDLHEQLARVTDVVETLISAKQDSL